MSARHKFFAAALLLTAVQASDHINNAYHSLERTHEPVAHRTRFNLESALKFAKLDISEGKQEVGAQEDQGYNEYWQSPEHENEPPEHNPKYYDDDPSVEPEEAYDHEQMEDDIEFEDEESSENDPGKPKNYFFEYPAPPTDGVEDETPYEHDLDEPSLSLSHHQAPVLVQQTNVFQQETRSPEEMASLTEALQHELAKRHLGHKRVPIIQKTTLSDIKDTNLRSLGVSQLVETYYDDLSKDSKLYQTEADHLVETTIGFLPDEDGILKTFIDRYTTMMVHDSIFMEEHPSPHDLIKHQQSLLNPMIHGGHMASAPWDLTVTGVHAQQEQHPSLEHLLSQYHVQHHQPSYIVQGVPIHESADPFVHQDDHKPADSFLHQDDHQQAYYPEEAPHEDGHGFLESEPKHEDTHSDVSSEQEDVGYHEEYHAPGPVHQPIHRPVHREPELDVIATHPSVEHGGHDAYPLATGHLQPHVTEEERAYFQHHEVPRADMHAHGHVHDYDHTVRYEQPIIEHNPHAIDAPRHPPTVEAHHQPSTYDAHRHPPTAHPVFEPVYNMHLTHGIPVDQDEVQQEVANDEGEDSDENYIIQGAQYLDFNPREGARHVSDLLGMHIKHSEELQIAERDAETAHRYHHHPTTRYDPDHFVAHDDIHELSVHHERVEGLPVHNKYGERVIEHDPYHQEYVHGTNYELVGMLSEPVIEHNSHAFPSLSEKQDMFSHLSDIKHTPAPKEQLKAEPKKKATAKAAPKATAPKAAPKAPAPKPKAAPKPVAAPKAAAPKQQKKQLPSPTPKLNSLALY